MTMGWLGWLRDDYGMTMGWLWDDYGMTMGWLWDDYGMTMNIHQTCAWLRSAVSQPPVPQKWRSIRSSTAKIYWKKTWQVLPNHRWTLPMPLPHRCGNAAHEMDGFRAGFQEHNHLSSRSCGPSAALCGLRATTLTTPCNSAHWVSVERKNKVIWFNLLQFDSTPWPVVESQHLRLQWLQAIYWWSSRPVSCKDLQFAWALTEVSSNLPKKHCHRSSGLDSTKLHNAIYIYVHICIRIRNIFNPFGSISHICIPLKVYSVIKVFLHGFVVNFQNQLDELSCLVQYLFDLAQRDRHRKCMPKARCNEADVLLFGSSAINAIHVFILCSWPFDAVRWEIEELLLHSSLLHCTYRSIDLFVWVRIRCLFNDFLLTVANSYGRPNQKASSVPHHTAHLVAWRGRSR